METTGLGTDVSALYGGVSKPATGFDIFSANDEEIKYANNKAKEDINRYFNQRSILRKALRSGEKSTGDKKADTYSANALALSDGIIKVLVEKGKDEKYLYDTYGKNNMKLIDITKGLEGGKYSADIDEYLNGDGTNLTGTLSKIFPDTMAKIQNKEYVQPEKEEKNWGGRFVENFMGFMPKVAESANDAVNLVKLKMGLTDDRSVMFGNYIYEKYGAGGIKNVPDELLEKDYKEFMALPEEKRNEYMPTWTGAAVKGIEGVGDVMITATPGGAAIKGLLSATGATPGVNLINEGLGMAVGGLGWLVNQVPGLSNIRDNLQNEKEKQEWDAFLGGIALQKATKAWKVSKNLKSSDFTDAFETYKKSGFKNAFKELSDKATGKSEAQLQQKKSDLAQNITQPETEGLLKSTEQGLDTISKSKDISKINSIDELSKSIDDEIKTQKINQMNAAKAEDVNISSEQLLDKTPSKVVGGERARVTSPVTSMLDLLIDYYKDVDIRMVDKYKSYKSAIESGTIKLSDLLELKRDANTWGEGLYDNMGNAIDTKLAGKFDTLRGGFNKVIDGLKGGENLRKTDSVLHSLYDLQKAVKDIKNEAFKEKGRAGKQSILGKTLGRMAKGLMFGAGNAAKRFYASLMQEVFGVEPKKMSISEVSRLIPDFLKDYKTTQQQLQRAKNINEATNIFNKFAETRGLGSWSDFSQAFSEQKAGTPKGLILGQYNDEGREDVGSFFSQLEEREND